MTDSLGPDPVRRAEDEARETEPCGCDERLGLICLHHTEMYSPADLKRMKAEWLAALAQQADGETRDDLDTVAREANLAGRFGDEDESPDYLAARERILAHVAAQTQTLTAKLEKAEQSEEAAEAEISTLAAQAARHREAEQEWKDRLESEVAVSCTYQRQARDLEAEVARLRARLAEITKGEGPFSLDQYQHACNTIESMKAIAIEALKGSPA